LHLLLLGYLVLRIQHHYGAGRVTTAVRALVGMPPNHLEFTDPIDDVGALIFVAHAAVAVLRQVL
jgi:hypothetical protein